MQINLPGPQSKYPQALDQHDANRLLPYNVQKNKPVFMYEGISEEIEKLKQHLSILQRLRRLRIYNKIAHVPKAPL